MKNICGIIFVDIKFSRRVELQPHLSQNYMIKLIFVFCFAAVSSVSIFGQSLEADLRRSFNRFGVVRINDQEALRKARLRLPFRISSHEKTFQFVLRLNDIRSANYNAEYTDRNGRHRLPRGEVFTYKTTLIGERNSVVALTVDGTKTEGYIATETEGFFIESARGYSSFATNEDKVVYQVRDRINRNDDICGLDEMVTAEMENISSKADSNFASIDQTGRKVLEVATEADTEFVQYPGTGNGSPATANSDILSVMNQVDAVFERDLNLSVVVTYQHAWMPGTPDPYAGFSVGIPLLNGFRDYWETNFPRSNPNYHRDVGFLFNARWTVEIGGMANKGVVCSSPSLSYGYSASTRFDKWIVVAHELGHNLDATHPDEENPMPPNCTGSIMLSSVPIGNPSFCPFSINQIINRINNYGNCLHLDPIVSATTLFDFDADGEADLSVFRPSDGFWYIQQSTAGFVATAFGLSTDKLAPADYDGDGKTDIATFRDGTWYLQRSTQGFLSSVFGATGDIPVPGDFTGDGKAELVVFRPSTGFWYTYDLTNNQTGGMQFGATGDKPLLGDFDNDSKSDYAVFRPSTGEWLIQRSTQGYYSVTFGFGTDKPAPADYDGDGKTDIAVFRPSIGTWIIQRSSLGLINVTFGQSGDIPAPADYDGDAKADISLFRPSDGTWYRKINSSTTEVVSIIFGLNGDIPIPSFNIVQ